MNLGSIPHILRQEYLNTNLPFPARAISHIRVSPEVWRYALVGAYHDVVKTASLFGNMEDIPAVDPWRGSWGTLPSLVKYGTVHFGHLGMKRDENQPHKTAKIYLKLDPGIIKRRRKYIIIADIMLATGGSFRTTIEILKAYGVSNEEIIITALISAPEGIYNLMQLYPGISIITGVLDRCLNKHGYIDPGLGDAGDKLCDKLSIDFFHEYDLRPIFTNSEWRLLNDLILEANYSSGQLLKLWRASRRFILDSGDLLMAQLRR